MTVDFFSIAKNKVSLTNKIRATYLSALENPKAYDYEWEQLVVELRNLLKDPTYQEMFPNLETEILYSDKTLDVKEKRARQVYESCMNKPMLVKEDEEMKSFIEPNKPMYRIFSIDDMREIKGLTGEYIIQEKYDGLRVQVHKKGDKITIYSFSGRDITSKFPKCVKYLKEKDTNNFILDGEAVLYKDNEPLVRADTLAHINKKVDSEEDIKIHVFDIMHYKDSSVAMEKFEDRIKILIGEFSGLTNEVVLFPTKQNTREADSYDEIEEYAMEIMKNPTSEGVVIKDAKSSYVIGKKKNPKWIKWKKVIDLDVLVLGKRKNKNGTFTYMVGVGPVEEETPKAREYEGNFYADVGKTTNTKVNVEEGKIIRVKVDEVMGNSKKGFSLYNAQFHEIPEVSESDKLITLEFLTKNGRKSLADYKVEALKKSYVITDGVHGIAKMNLELNMDGLVFHGFKEKNLMSKNAYPNMDVWKKEIKRAYGKDSGRFMAFVQNILIDEGTKSLEELFRRGMDHDANMMNRLFGDKEGKKKMKQRLMEAGDAYGIKGKDRFFYDDLTLNKMEENKAEFLMWLGKDEKIYFTIKHEDFENNWAIDIRSKENIYDFLGEAGKYPVSLVSSINDDMLIDKGSALLGAQRHGYHEYILSGDDVQSKLHIRYLPVGDEKMWLAFTGYETKPTPESSDEGLNDARADKFIKM
ncbi:RNA ligase family protein [Altibacter sp.]|uniref:ATP-dependent DNA ligase n=1 Tax=Altibacter sp. TaxID=2024823 RepID=UPI0025B8B556|nr:RNA ligase family protein [Altibacter sp.]